MEMFSVNDHNRIQSAREVNEWNSVPPLRYFAYVDEKRRKLVTWMGDVLGDIQLGYSYTVNSFGRLRENVRQSIRVRATNGQWYSGTYYASSGNYCRIK